VLFVNIKKNMLIWKKKSFRCYFKFVLHFNLDFKMVIIKWILNECTQSMGCQFKIIVLKSSPTRWIDPESYWYGFKTGMSLKKIKKGKNLGN
jgi:hypothetical protein